MNAAKPAPARIYDPLPDELFQHLVKHHIKGYKVGDRIVVVVSTSGHHSTCPLPRIDEVTTCTHPPCPGGPPFQS
jgi:hypothetical protein